MVLNVRGEARVCVPASIEQMTTYVLLEQEDWFEQEIALLRGLLQPGQRAIDVGANHGVYTLALARAAGPGGRVWAFEPAPLTADYLARTLALNGLEQVELVRTAVSDRSGTAALVVGAQSELNAIAAEGRPGAVEVPAAPLDELAREHGWREIDFVKIDAEGHEQQVIAGGQAFFASQSPLVMFEIAAAGGQDLGPAARFRALGYGIFRLLPGPGLLAPLEAGEPLDSYLLNLFACKPERAQRLAQAGRMADAAQLRSLRAALDQAARALNEPADLPRLVAHARLARDFGARAQAFQSFRAARKLVPAQWRAMEPAHAMPLQGSPAWTPAAGSLQDWLACELARASLETGYHSSYFAGPEILPLLDSLQHNPFLPALLARMRQLVRMRAGMQARPEPHPLLVRTSEQNLNPDYWRGNS
jgi:FkbM family methyltransferase